MRYKNHNTTEARSRTVTRLVTTLIDEKTTLVACVFAVDKYAYVMRIVYSLATSSTMDGIKYHLFQPSRPTEAGRDKTDGTHTGTSSASTHNT